METKVCTKCGVEKELIEFRSRNDRPKNPYRSDCRKCEYIIQKQYKENNKEILSVKQKQYRENNKEILSIKQKKYREENKYYFSEYYRSDKEKERKRIWRENNINYQNEYRKENKEKVKERHDKYYEENKERVKKRVKEYSYNRMKIDPLYKLSASIRHLIWRSITSNGYTKESRTCDILGCDFIFFKNYLENLFKDDMNWNNYGKWHIDHKIPSSWGKTKEEVYELNYYTNLQPMWAGENLSKGNRYKSE